MSHPPARQRNNLLADSEAPVRRRRCIWLCADDYGISPSVSLAIRDLAARGSINATSVMVGAPSFHRAEANALDIINANGPRISVGLHVTMTAPFRPLTQAFMPAPEGRFLPLMKMGVQSFLRRLDPAALKEEIAAQLRQFIDLFGRAPRFIDGHQHVHLFPQVRDAVLEIARETAPCAWVRQCGSPLSFFETMRNRKELPLDLMSRAFRRRAIAQGRKTNPAFTGAYDYRDDVDFAALFPRFLDGLPDGSVVMCHPGFVDAELRRLDPLTILREREYAYFSSDAFPDVLAAFGLVLAPASAELTS